MADEDGAALVVRLEARISAFEQQMNKAVRASYGAASRIEKAFAASNDNIGRKSKSSSGFGNVLSSSFKEVENGAKGLSGRLGPAASVIESLGPAGLIAGAGLGVLIVALSQAKAAMDMADELSDSAAKLGTNIETLQEYRFAVRAAGGELTDADKALASFNATLGQAQAGYKKPLKVFELLGFTKADLDQVRSGEELLPRIADKIRALGSEAQRAAIIDKLGLTGLKPLLEEGAAGMEKLIQAQRDLGIVLSSETIAKAAEAHDKLESLSTVIDTQLKVAFIGLSGPILDATQHLADFLGWTAKVLNDPGFQRMMRATAQINSAGAKGFVMGGPLGAAIGEVKAARHLDLTPDVTMSSLKDFLALPPKAKPGNPPNLVTLPPGSGAASAKDKAAADGRNRDGPARTPAGFVANTATSGAEFAETPDLFTPNGGLLDPNNIDSTFKTISDGLAKADVALSGLVKDTHDGLYNAASGALDAAFSGGAKGVLRFFLQSLQKGLIHSLSEKAASVGDAASASGKGGWLSKFAGLFDAGGNIPSGKWGIAGEHGPEPVKGPATIIGRAATMRALQGAGSARAAAPVVHQRFDFSGALIWENEATKLMSFATGQAQRYAGAAGSAAVSAAGQNAPGVVAAKKRDQE